MNFQVLKLELEKTEEPEIKLLTSFDSLRKQESSRKKSVSASLTTPKPLTVWITTNCGKFLKRDGNTRPPYLPSEIPVGKSRSKSEPDMEQWTGLKLGEKYIKAEYCHPAYSTCIM